MHKSINQTLDKTNQTRFDGITSSITGMGTSSDKLTYTKPTYNEYSEMELLCLYVGIPQISSIVDVVAEDLYREGFEIRSSGNQALADEVAKEFERLKIKDRLVELRRNHRIYSKGGLLYPIITTDNEAYPVQAGSELKNPMPTVIDSIEEINSIPGYLFNVSTNTGRPTERKYNQVNVSCDGHELHESRFLWSCNNFQPQFNQGISEVEKLVMIANGLQISAWSLINMIYEAQLKVYRSKALLENGAIAKIKETLRAIRMSLSSQSAMVIGADEDFTKQNFVITGFKDATDFLENQMSAVSDVPKEIWMKQSRGVISLTNNPQSISYYQSRIKEQNLEETPKIKSLIDIILKQKKFNGAMLDDIQIKWNDMFTLDEDSQATIRLKNAQADQIEITSGVISANDVANKRYPNLSYDYPQVDYELKQQEV